MIDFIYTAMHPSHGDVKYPQAILNIHNDKDWADVCLIDTYYHSNGYQDNDHIDCDSFSMFFRKHKPTFKPPSGRITTIAPAPEAIGDYFLNNKATVFGNATPHFDIHNDMDHRVGIDFSQISTHAAENAQNVADVDVQNFKKHYRFYSINREHTYIRRSAKHDLAPIAELFRGDPEFGFMSNHIINGFLEKPNCIALTLCDKGTNVIGTYLAKIISDNEANHNVVYEAYLKVSEDYQGKGLGKKLWNTLVDISKKIGAKYIYGDCLADGKSRYFYEYLGGVFGSPRENAQKQKLVRFYYRLDSNEKTFF